MSASQSAAPVARTVVKCKALHTSQAPLNHAIAADRLVYTSGNLGLDRDGKLVTGGIRAETEQAMKNLGEVLKASGSGFDRVVKVTILLADIADWPTVNEIYKKFFAESIHYPARTAYQAGALPMGARVEIEAVAVRGNVTQANL